jgi:hypothetical protein
MLSTGCHKVIYMIRNPFTNPMFNIYAKHFFAALAMPSDDGQ